MIVLKVLLLYIHITRLTFEGYMPKFAGIFIDTNYGFDYNPAHFGGFDIYLDDHPYQTSLQSHFKNGSKDHFCAGVIINRTTVLTAANCFTDKTLDDTDTEYVIAAGIISWKSPKAVIHKIDSIEIHPLFNRSSPLYNNIAKVNILGTFKWSKSIKPIDIAEESPREGDTCNVTGWSKTSEHIFDDMLGQQIVIRNRFYCEKYFTRKKFDRKTMLCSSDFIGQIECIDDYGGPLVCRGKLSGIRTGVNGDGCTIGDPDRYIDISRYYEWIGERNKSFMGNKMTISSFAENSTPLSSFYHLFYSIILFSLFS